MSSGTATQDYLLLFLRQVCKSWHAAVESYPTEIGLYDSQFPRVCKLLPNISDLQVCISRTPVTDLRCVQAHTQLTSLELTQEEYDEPSLQLSFLPPSLKHFTMNGFKVDAEDLQHFECHSMTLFESTYWFSPVDFSQLLPRLANLQV